VGGITLSLFAAGIVLFVLLIASYSRRGTWLALGSMALSMALLFGCLVLATTHDRSQVRSRLAWVANKLPFLLDQQTFADLAASLERVPVAPSPASPVIEREPMQAAATTGWFETKPEPKADSQYPVAWQLDDRDAPLPVSSPWGFSISGTNVASEALEEVHAVLKPDSTGREIELVVDVEGRALEAGAVIPPNAQFSLISAAPYGDDAKPTGGAILTFRYMQAGQRKSSILYLTPSMVARFASRG
jgi:hypothetical protein